MYQIRKRKRKSRAYEVASRVQTEDRCITSIEAMSRNENSNDWWLQTNTSIMILLILICGQMIFLTKPVMTSFYFYRKILEEKPLPKYQASLQKKNSWF